MFESIGRNQDQEAHRRRLKAMGITGSIAAIGFAVGYILTPPPQTPLSLPDPDPGPIVCLDCQEPLQPQEEPPEAPVYGKRGGGDADPVPDDEMHERITYREPSSSKVVSQADPAGTGEGEGPGTGNDGTTLGGCTGDDCGSGRGGDGAIDVHHTKLEARSQPQPEYPQEARRRRLGEARCKASLKIDRQGKVYDVRVSDCDPLFQRATRQALSQWTFRPVTTTLGEPVEARTIVGVTFKR